MAALLLASAAAAQNSVNDYRLPPAPSQQQQPVQGPVDTENPAAMPPAPAAASPAPTAQEQPRATPSPRITLPPVTGDAVRRQTPAQTRQQPPGQVAPLPSVAPPSEPARTQTLPLPPPPDVAPVPVTEPAREAPTLDWRLLALLGLLGATILGIAMLLRRRRCSRGTDPAATGAMDSTLSASAPAALKPITPSAPPPRKPAAPVDDTAFILKFEPVSLRLSVVYATLAYRLHLDNRGPAPVSGLRISGDMISAHASIPAEDQLRPETGLLQPLHAIDALAPGEAITLSAELRLPLSHVLGLRAGPAVLFAPLARLLCEAEDGLRELRLFSIGLPSDRPGGTMRPFRLDLGPQLFREVEQRPVDPSRRLPSDAMRRAG